MCGMQDKGEGITSITPAGCPGNASALLPPVSPTQPLRQHSSPSTLANEGLLPSAG